MALVLALLQAASAPAMTRLTTISRMPLPNISALLRRSLYYRSSQDPPGVVSLISYSRFHRAMGYQLLRLVAANWHHEPGASGMAIGFVLLLKCQNCRGRATLSGLFYS